MQSPSSIRLNVLPTRVDGVEALTRQLAAQRKAPPVVKLELILTEACNLGCSYCFEYGADASQTMDASTALGAVDLLLSASRDQDWVGVTFMGGEPMLRFDLIRQVVDYARAKAPARGKRVTFDMQTNGLLIKEEHAQYFNEVGLRYCLSIDGAPATHDTHRKTLGGGATYQILARKMRLLKAYQPWQGTRMTVMPEFAADLARNVARLHEDLAINQFVIGFATHVPWPDRQIADYAYGLRDAFDYFVAERVERRSRRLRIGLFELGRLDEALTPVGEGAWGCGAGSGRLAVSPSGVLHGCSKLAWGTTGGSRGAPLPLGTVVSGLSLYENRAQLLDHTSTPRVKCRSCELAPSCQGGCHAANFADTGNIYIPSDEFCKLMFAQKHACDYARARIKALGLDDLFWSSDIPDLEAEPGPWGEFEDEPR